MIKAFIRNRLELDKEEAVWLGLGLYIIYRIVTTIRFIVCKRRVK